jgi:hypothetical protein
VPGWVGWVTNRPVCAHQSRWWPHCNSPPGLCFRTVRRDAERCRARERHGVAWWAFYGCPVRGPGWAGLGALRAARPAASALALVQAGPHLTSVG